VKGVSADALDAVPAMITEVPENRRSLGFEAALSASQAPLGGIDFEPVGSRKGVSGAGTSRIVKE